MTDDYGFQMDDQEAQILESLIKSPAFTVLKKVLERYRKECYSTLLNSKDASKIFETQGRIIGINVVENLPPLLVKRRQAQIKTQEKRQSFKKANVKNI